MQRRKFLIGAGSLAAATAGAIGTGAFSSAAAERNYTINIAGDAAAYLTINVNSDFDPLIVQQGDGTVAIDLTNNGKGGQGVNENAFTKFIDFFSVQNKGTNRVAVWLNEGNSSDDVVEDDLGASADLVNSLAAATGSPENSVGAALFWAIANRSQTSSYDPFGTDSGGNDFEFGLDDSGVLRPDNINTDIITDVTLADEHPAVLRPGEQVWVTHMINTKSGTGADLNPSNVDDFSGTITLNAYTAEFADGL